MKPFLVLPYCKARRVKKIKKSQPLVSHSFSGSPTNKNTNFRITKTTHNLVFFFLWSVGKNHMHVNDRSRNKDNLFIIVYQICFIFLSFSFLTNLLNGSSGDMGFNNLEVENLKVCFMITRRRTRW